MAKQFDAYVEGLNEVLRAFRRLPKEASAELKTASQQIASRHMVPAWQDAAINAGPWGEQIAGSVKAARDRIPAVRIGGNRKVFSGGASATMVRYPSDKGDRGRAAKGATNRMPPAFGSGSNWIDNVRNYQPAALQEWGRAVDRVIAKWSGM